ncbi:hypothetical protein KIN20_026746 [Parelaphostrongylus tenuis]|uniref:Uncharacterized protein n=1 Tax=Parelaphostrongylus tenuis TaxID=148309 RepID=A0AAD5QYG3_PARTN|nr:hypothetical protein KIN20_026746 [Parelaphostrongylus tenuis]
MRYNEYRSDSSLLSLTDKKWLPFANKMQGQAIIRSRSSCLSKQKNDAQLSNAAQKEQVDDILFGDYSITLKAPGVFN